MTGGNPAPVLHWLMIFFQNIINPPQKIAKEITELNKNRQREVIALAKFMQGQSMVNLDEIKKILNSYVKTVQQFRSPQKMR